MDVQVSGPVDWGGSMTTLDKIRNLLKEYVDCNLPPSRKIAQLRELQDDIGEHVAELFADAMLVDTP
jgi:hypothetical protein